MSEAELDEYFLLKKCLEENVINVNLEAMSKHHDFRNSVYRAMEAYLKQYLEQNIPSDEEIEEASLDYDKRSYFGHFAGEEPKYHYENGVKWLKQKLINK